MAGLKVEGDFSQINDRQIEFIKSVLEEKGYINNKVVIEPLGQAGDNYVANVKRITVEEDDGKTFKIVAKVAPTNEMLRAMMNAENLFRNEHIMYMKVLPKFTELEKSADVPVKDRLRYAACYGSLQEVPNEIILLEDLNQSDFVMLDRFKSLSDDCVKSILKNFALLHSLSYVLKYKEPEVFAEVNDSLFDMWATMDKQEQTVQYFKQVEASASMLLDSGFNKKAVLGAITGSLKEFVKIAKIDRNAKYSVIQQGDAWTNNILFKFDGEKLLESIMIDYQISKPANPTADILYMIFNCTDYEIRKTHYYNWIDYYHVELEKSLTNFGLKASLVYSKDQLDADLKRYSKINFGLSILLAGVLSMKSEEAGTMKAAMESADMNEMLKNTDITDKDAETVALFKKRIEGLIDSYRDLGFI